MRTLYLYILFAFSILTSCEKDITVDLPRPDQKFVIEGAIEDGEYPYVFITQNTAYFDVVSLEKIEDLTVKDAIVTVSDGNTTETLSLIYDKNHFPYYKYVGSLIKGQIGKTYTLNIKIGNYEITSNTTIPNKVLLDSISFKLDKRLKGDSLGYIWFYFNDPDTSGNYYKIYTKVLGEDSMFYQPVTSVSDDKIINNQFVEFSTYRGRNPLQEFTEETYNSWFFKLGDTIAFKFSSIELDVYNFWYTLEANSNSGGPFSSPISVKSNINGGLGIWAGYSTDIDTTIAIKKY